MEKRRLWLLIAVSGVVLEGATGEGSEGFKRAVGEVKERGNEGGQSDGHSESGAAWSYGVRRRVAGGAAMGRRRRRFYGRPRTRVGLSRKIVHRTSSVSTSVSMSNDIIAKMSNDIVEKQGDRESYKRVKAPRENINFNNEMNEEYTGDLKNYTETVEMERRVTKEDKLTQNDETVQEEKETQKVKVTAEEKVIQEEKLAAHRKRLRALLSPESRRIPRPVPPTTTEAPQEDPSQQPGDFRCPNSTEAEVVWRAFPSPSSCRLYYICVDGQEPQEHGCSLGKVFNENTQVCDEPHRVDGCEDFYREDTREDKGIGDGLDPDEEKQYFVEFVDMLRESGLFKRGLIDLLAKMMAT